MARLDRRAIEFALTNSSDNAIKYTEQGMVVVRVGRNEERARVEVTDTGLGDRARARVARVRAVLSGRSRPVPSGRWHGLASIVKHAINIHGGMCSQWSAPGLGKHLLGSRCPWRGPRTERPRKGPSVVRSRGSRAQISVSIRQSTRTERSLPHTQDRIMQKEPRAERAGVEERNGSTEHTRLSWGVDWDSRSRSPAPGEGAMTQNGAVLEAESLLLVRRPQGAGLPSAWAFPTARSPRSSAPPAAAKARSCVAINRMNDTFP